MSSRFSEIAHWFQTLSPKSLERVGEMYAQDAVFVDPFNQLEGLASVRAVYQHMFDTLKQPRFVVTRIVERERDGFMTWDFLFECRGQAQQISGCTQFELNDQGLIVLHRDYWDAAQQVYEKIPLLGSVLRMIRRKLSLPTTA
jgi:hypothetical protein